MDEPLAAIIVFLVWLWISNVAILLGAEFNAELERVRLIQGGRRGIPRAFVEPRDTRRMTARSDWSLSRGPQSRLRP